MEKDREYKDRFRGVFSYRLYTKWIQKTSVVSETDTHITIDTGSLKEYQVSFLYEYHIEDLENIFEKKVILKRR